MVERLNKQPDIRENEAFENWGGTVQTTLDHLLYAPKTVEEVQKFVESAKDADKSVRCNGFCHSWSSIFGDDQQYQISLLTKKLIKSRLTFQECLDKAAKIKKTELNQIEVVGKDEATGKGLIRLGAATLNAQFLNWTNQQLSSGVEELWALPLNVIMIEITFAGSNAPICHGAGINTQTLSDLVYELEYIDCNGKLQKFKADSDSSKLLMQSASGCFGLLGVVTHLTLKADPMTYAHFTTFKEDILEAVPYPSDYDSQINGSQLPREVKKAYSKMSLQDKQQAFAKFAQRCEESYYSEFFWFPFQSKSYVLAWKNDANKSDAVGNHLSSKLSEIGSAAIQAIMTTAQNLIPKDKRQKLEVLTAKVFGTLAMAQLKTYDTQVQLMEALHFRRGIQNFEVLDMEVEIPLPKLANGSIDWSIAHKAWWDVIMRVYEIKKKDNRAPMKVALEMRVVGLSEVTLSPFRVNQCDSQSDIGAFCSIEVLTIGANHCTYESKDEYLKEWETFCQDIFERWCKYRDYNGNIIYPRPHFAKQWEFLKYVHPETKVSQDIKTYLKNTVLKERIPQFRNDLEEIAKQSNPPFSFEDMKKRFHNQTLSEFLFSE